MSKPEKCNKGKCKSDFCGTAAPKQEANENKKSCCPAKKKKPKCCPPKP